jgi:hypothetical protein
MFRSYEVDSKGVALAASLTPILYFATTSTNDAHIVRFRAIVEGVSSSSAPAANSSVIFTINAVTGTVGGGGSVTPVQRGGGSALAANTTFTSANAAAITGLTQGSQVGILEVPYMTGAWEEDVWENTGFEIDIAPSTKYCVYMIASQAGTACNGRAVLKFTE